MAERSTRKREGTDNGRRNGDAPGGAERERVGIVVPLLVAAAIIGAGWLATSFNAASRTSREQALIRSERDALERYLQENGLSWGDARNLLESEEAQGCGPGADQRDG